MKLQETIAINKVFIYQFIFDFNCQFFIKTKYNVILSHQLSNSKNIISNIVKTNTDFIKLKNSLYQKT